MGKCVRVGLGEEKDLRTLVREAANWWSVTDLLGGYGDCAKSEDDAYEELEVMTGVGRHSMC